MFSAFDHEYNDYTDLEPYYECNEYDDWSYDDPVLQYNTGKKGGKSSKGGNPWKDGKQMLCDTCGSSSHFRAHCPQAGSGSSSSFAILDAWQPGQQQQQPSPSTFTTSTSRVGFQDVSQPTAAPAARGSQHPSDLAPNYMVQSNWFMGQPDAANDSVTYNQVMFASTVQVSEVNDLQSDYGDLQLDHRHLHREHNDVTFQPDHGNLPIDPWMSDDPWQSSSRRPRQQQQFSGVQQSQRSSPPEQSDPWSLWGRRDSAGITESTLRTAEQSFSVVSPQFFRSRSVNTPALSTSFTAPTRPAASSTSGSSTLPGLFDTNTVYLYLDQHNDSTSTCCLSGLLTWIRSKTISVFPMWTSGQDRLLQQCVEGNIYHMRARLRDGREGLLIDPGAVSNLAGDEWVKRVGRLAKEQGLSMKYSPLDHQILVEGVGNGSQTCAQNCSIPVKTQAPSTFQTFEAPVVPRSTIPGLLGLAELKERNCVLDCKHGFLYEVQGSYSLTAGKGTVKHVLEPAMSGHWMLPITQYSR